MPLMPRKILAILLVWCHFAASIQALMPLSQLRGPDYSNDKFPPYPPMTNLDGTNITTQNLRGTRLYGWKGCDVSEAKAIAEAYVDFQKLASPLASNIDWASKTAEDFWGNDKGMHRLPDDRRRQIQQIFQAQQQMYAIGWHLLPPWWKSLWIEVRCSGGDGSGDPQNECRDQKPNDGRCGSDESEPTGGDDNSLEAFVESPTFHKQLTYSRITFCTGFFNLPSLSEVMTITPKRPKATRENLASWNNRARVFLHETTHLDWFMNTPHESPMVNDLKIISKASEQDSDGEYIKDWTYGVAFCKILKNYGRLSLVGFYPQRNADSFAWFALGAYIKQVTGTYPPNPSPRLVPLHDPWDKDDEDVKGLGRKRDTLTRQTDASPSDDSTNDLEHRVPRRGCSDIMMKQGAKSAGMEDIPKVPPPETPPPATASIPDRNICHGISGDYWVMSRDVAVSNVKDFCGQTEHSKKYNVGSVNELELSVKNNNDDSRSPKDSPSCVERFQNAVIDGCDGDDAVNNPHNYKFGSTLTTGDGWEYRMTPLSRQVNELNCDASYKFFWDGFEIRGKNWREAELGAGGEGLLKELRGCGVVSDWKFEQTPNDCCFQWYSSGSLPIGTRDCVGRAVQSAGASSPGNCWGPGRRGLRRRDNIDNWPGYGDSSRHVFENVTSA